MATSANPNPMPVAEPARRDFRQEVTDRIINMLETGVAPWQKPWNPADASLDMPMNPTTGKAYRGGNAIHLMATGLHRGYEDPRWMTYRQAAGLAWQVRKGEKGTQIEFWEVKAGRDTRSEPIRTDDGDGHKPGDEPDDGRGNRLIHRVYTVFNAKQIEGIPEWTPSERTAFEVVESADHILKNSGATIRHDQTDCAFYNRSSDSIHLPPKQAFKDAAGYYGTALHEPHWSGHPSRLDRPTLNESYRFGDLSYAKEELRAELASLFLSAERGIPDDPEQHAAYVSSWINVLKQDKNEIFRATHDASRAADFLLALERDRSIAGEELPAAPLLDSAEFGSVRSVVPEREARNGERDRPDRKVALAPSTSSPGKAPNPEMSGRSRTMGRADDAMQPKMVRQGLTPVEPRDRPSPIEFEMAYQARVAIDRIRFAIKHTDQSGLHSDEMREVGLQLLDALERLETIDRRFQERSRNGVRSSAGEECESAR